MLFFCPELKGCNNSAVFILEIPELAVFIAEVSVI
jgi:hypothetical protein